MNDKIDNVKIKKYRTVDDLLAENFSHHPEDLEGYLRVALEDYREDKDLGTLLLALRTIAEAKGTLPAIAEKLGIPVHQLVESMSPNGNPDLSLTERILLEFGLEISIQPCRKAIA